MQQILRSLDALQIHLIEEITIASGIIITFIDIPWAMRSCIHNRLHKLTRWRDVLIRLRSIIITVLAINIAAIHVCLVDVVHSAVAAWAHAITTTTTCIRGSISVTAKSLLELLLLLLLLLLMLEPCYELHLRHRLALSFQHSRRALINRSCRQEQQLLVLLLFLWWQFMPSRSILLLLQIRFVL